MKKMSSLWFAAFLLMQTFSIARAHLPPGELFFAAEFPDEFIPTIDGDDREWLILPSIYQIGNERLFDPDQIQGAGRGDIEFSDVSILHMVGWNDTYNKICD